MVVPCPHAIWGLLKKAVRSFMIRYPSMPGGFFRHSPMVLVKRGDKCHASIQNNREMIGEFTISMFNLIGRSEGPFQGWLCKIADSKSPMMWQPLNWIFESNSEGDLHIRSWMMYILGGSKVVPFCVCFLGIWRIMGLYLVSPISNCEFLSSKNQRKTIIS
jgi:hypothetical protein